MMIGGRPVARTRYAGGDCGSADKHHDHAAHGWSIHLFVQSAKGEAFAYLGPVHHARSEGSRPIAIVWRLEHPLPAALFQQYATLAGG